MTRTAPSTACATSATLGRAPAVPGKEQHAEVEGQRSQGELAQDGGGKRDPLPAETQPRLDLQLPDVDVLLELAGKKLARLRVQPGDVRRERQDDEQKSDRRVRKRGSWLAAPLGAVAGCARCARPARQAKRTACAAGFPGAASALIAFVIVAGQMQQAVQDQYLNFHL